MPFRPLLLLSYQSILAAAAADIEALGASSGVMLAVMQPATVRKETFIMQKRYSKQSSHQSAMALGWTLRACVFFFYTALNHNLARGGWRVRRFI